MEEIYLIFESQLDYLENDSFAANYEEPIGYVKTIEEAKEIVRKGKVYIQKDCWAVLGEQKQYSFKKIKYFNLK